MKSLLKLLLLLLISLILIEAPIEYTAAFAVLPSQYYGTIKLEGRYLNTGNNITAYDSNGVLCDSYIINKTAEYYLSCKGDDLSTNEDEGAIEGDKISIHVNNRRIEVYTIWHQGEFTKLDIDTFFANNIIQTTQQRLSPLKDYPEIYLLCILFIFIMVFTIIKIRKSNTKKEKRDEK